MEAHREGEVIEQEVRIAARPETIFPFFTEPARVVRWMGVEAELEPRPGGVFRVRINRQVVASGQYVEVVPPTRVVFTFGWEGDSPVPPGTTTVEVTLTPDGDGTLVRLRHAGLPVDQRPQHTQGWSHYMERLAVVAADGDPGPDPWATPEGHMG